MPLVGVDAPLHADDGEPADLAEAQVALVPGHGRRDHVRKVAIGNLHAPREVVGERAEAAPEDDTDLRGVARVALADGEDAVVEPRGGGRGRRLRDPTHASPCPSCATQRGPNFFTSASATRAGAYRLTSPPWLAISRTSEALMKPIF